MIINFLKSNKSIKSFRNVAEVKLKQFLRKSIQKYRLIKFNSSSKIYKKGNSPNLCLKLFSVKKLTDNICI